MKTEFDALFTGVRNGNQALQGNVFPVPKIPAGLGEFYALGLELAESMHWVATAGYLTEMQRDEASYSLIADVVNDKFDKIVVETFRDKPDGNVGFIHPETGERISFYE
jgi:hypothetical protein